MQCALIGSEGRRGENWWRYIEKCFFGLSAGEYVIGERKALIWKSVS